MKEILGSVRGGGRRIAIVAARFNELVVRKLVEGAEAGLVHHGVVDEQIDLVWVPGAFELPLAADRLASLGRYDAIICLGAVIRGETAHFDFVAKEAARGIRETSQRVEVPILFGVLTTETLDQALERAGGSHGNKGWDSAEAALEMVGLLEVLATEVTQ